jgi:hydroxymethylpyrimidine pyrophosphatase-like HAD family hydrolase
MKNVQSITAGLISTVSFLDVDGPVVDPTSRKPSKDVIMHIASTLLAGNPVVLNTGRDASYVLKNVVFHVLLFSTIEALSRLIIIGEYGGSVTTFDTKGVSHTVIDDELLVPLELRYEFRNLIERGVGNYRAYFSLDKDVGVTLERAGETEQLAHEWKKHTQHPEMLELVSRSEKLVEGTPFKVLWAPTAIDIMHEKASKAYGARKGIEALQAAGYDLTAVSRFISFGDAVSDADMAHELYRFLGETNSTADNIFVYVGDAHLAETVEAVTSPDFKTYISNAQNTEGTMEALAYFGMLS